MRFSFFLGLAIWLFALTSCSYFWQKKEGTSLPIQEINSTEVTSVIQDFSVQVEHEKKLHLEHANTYYNDGIHAIGLQFSSQDIIDMCEARKLIVDISELLLAKLNQNPLLGEQFTNFPFRPSNLEIYITFESFYGRYVDPYHIAWICLEDGEIAYYTFDTLDSQKDCWHVRREAYSTSRKIVISQRQAENGFKETHALHPEKVFGNTRYFPPDGFYP